MLFALAAALSCIAVDGDTLRCGRERIRLTGVDAPELPGHCRRGRVCVPGDGNAAKRSLADALTIGPIRIERRGYDHYGRTLASVSAGGVDLACWQLRRGMAEYISRWDSDRAVARACRWQGKGPAPI